jgi:hypothetical protein
MRFVQQALVAALVSAVAVTPVHAQLPTTAQVYEAYANAIGGRDAWSKVDNRTDTGSVNVTFAGLTGSYARYNSAPNKFRLVIGLSVGDIDQGSDGTVVWMSQPGQPPVPVGDADAKYLLESAVTGDAFLDPTRFASATVTAKENFDGVECYKVELRTHSGKNRTDYFEVATGLRRGQVLASENGPQSSTFRDYKVFDGKKVATTIVQANGQGDVIISVTKVTFTPIPAATFTAPAGIAK